MTAPAGAALSRRRITELLRFVAVGASSTLLYFGVYTGAVVVGVAFGLAAVLAFLISAVCGYLLHHRWTFRTNAASTSGLARWLALQGTLIALNILVLWLLVERAGLNPIVAQLLILPLIPLLTYALSRRHVYGMECG